MSGNAHGATNGAFKHKKPTEVLEVSEALKGLQDHEAERFILGSLWADNGIWDDHEIDPDHFSEPRNRLLASHTASLLIRGGRADAALARKALAEVDPGNMLASDAYIQEVRACIASRARVGEYVHTVKRAAEARRVVMACGDVIVKAKLRDEDLAGSFAKIAADIASGSGSPSYQHISAGADAQLADLLSARKPGISTGLTALDKITGGLHPGRLYILGARPKQGKTAVLLTQILHLAKRGIPTAFFSLELPADQVRLRLVSMLTGIAYETLSNKTFDASAADDIADAFEAIKSWPLDIDVLPTRTTGALAARCRAAVKDGVQVIFGDYLTKLSPSGKSTGKYEQVTNVCLDLEDIKNSLNVPLVFAAQLNRDGVKKNRETNFTKFDHMAYRPVDTDLRDSGQIEQSADVLVFLNRPEFYLQKLKPMEGDINDMKAIEAMADYEAEMAKWRNKAELIVYFNRHGRDGDTMFHFDGPTMKFSDLSARQ